MKNKLRTILFIFLFSFNFVCLADPSSNLIDKATQAFDVDDVLNTLYSVVNVVRQLDFDRSTEVAIRIPVANQDLVYDWGFAGSGDLFTPIGTVKPYLRSVAESGNKDNFAIDLGKALLEDKANQYGHKVPLVDRVLQLELSPKVVFSIKLILLLKKINTVAKENIYADLVRLLIRLIQVDDFKILKEKNTFSSFLPETVISTVQKVAPELLIFMDEVFNAFAQTNDTNQLNDKVVSVRGFVFNDKEAVSRFFDKWQNSKEDNFVSELNNVIISAGYEKCNDYDQFVNLKDTGELKNKLFAFKDFGYIQTARQMPENLKSKVLSVDQFPKVLKLVSDDEAWIIYVTDKFGAAQTVKVLVSSLIQTFRDYKYARSNYFKENVSKDVQLKNLLDKQQRKISKMEKFLLTTTGQNSVSRIEDALNRINLDFAATSNVSSFKLELEQLSEKEEEFKKIIRLQSNGKLRQEEVKQILKKQEELKQLQKRKKILNKKIENSKKTTNQRKNELNEALIDLRTLEGIAIQKKSEDGIVNLELQNAIDELKEKIEQLQGNDDSVLSFNSRLKKRLMIAKAYLNEADLLEKELNLRLSEIDMIIDNAKKRIEELKFSVFKEQYELRIDDLKTDAQKIINDNEKAKELYELKEASKQVDDISDEQTQKIQKLENEVGYIVEGKQCVSKLMGYLQNNKEIKEFIESVNSQIPEYQGIKASLIKRLEFLVANSEYVKNNKAALDLLIKRLLPEFPISLRDVAVNK